jgi:hypothetical protein
MKQFLAILLSLAVPAAVFGDNSYTVKYDGGSVGDLKPGTEVHLQINAHQIRFSQGRQELIVIHVDAVTEVSYGQDVHRRIGAAIGLAVVSFGIGALMAFTKSKKHFVGLTWAGDHKGGLAMQCDKNEYRGILTTLEGVTGKKAINTDALTVKN